MTQEEKRNILLKDLCARLPYNIAIDCRNEDSRFTCYLTTDILREIQNNTYHWEYKPYLFPLTGMSEEQRNELHSLMARDSYGILYHTIDSFDYLYKNHFDYRGLIPMGLANDATGLNIY